MQSQMIVRPDAKGRITLGKLAKGVSSFAVTEREDHSIVLEPYAEVPAREKWLFENPEALASVKQGLKDAAEGKISKKGNFKRHLKDQE